MSSLAAPCAHTAITLPAIPLARLSFELQVVDPIRLPPYSGSAWRGLLGRGLRQSTCVTRQPTCDGCLLRAQCAYSTIFESPRVSAQIAARYRALPHPFVLEPADDTPEVIEPGALLTLGVTLIAAARHRIPYLIHALQGAGRLGFGRQGGRFVLRRVRQQRVLGRDDWAVVFDADDGVLHPAETVLDPTGPCPDPLRLRLVTPLRLKRQGQLVDASRLDARDLLFNLATRVALLGELYVPDGALLDLDAARAAIDRVELEPEGLRWLDWTRWSSRQRSHMQLGGVVGSAVLHGPGLARLWPLISLGQWLHVGKATSFGLGRYRVLADGETRS